MGKPSAKEVVHQSTACFSAAIRIYYQIYGWGDEV
jgi:hypothetical protein